MHVVWINVIALLDILEIYLNNYISKELKRLNQSDGVTLIVVI